MFYKHVAPTEREIASQRAEGLDTIMPMLHSWVFADFRNEREYFITAFDLILNIYKIAHHDPAVADLRESLREWEIR